MRLLSARNALLEAYYGSVDEPRSSLEVSRCDVSQHIGPVRSLFACGDKVGSLGDAALCLFLSTDHRRVESSAIGPSVIR
jgi:hypothetical protein